MRDPLSHAVSLFFNFGPRLGYFPAIDQQDTADLEAVLDNFVEFFLEGGPVGLCFNGDSDWFRDEFEVATGCDVYGQEFDADRGYQFFEAGKFSILLLKFERLAEVAPVGMQQLLNLPAPLPVGHKHSTDDKGYGTLYQRFKAETVMPPEVLERACGSKYASHFYSTDELERFAARWS